MQHNTTQQNTIQHNTPPYNIVQYNTIQHVNKYIMHTDMHTYVPSNNPPLWSSNHISILREERDLRIQIQIQNQNYIFSKQFFFIRLVGLDSQLQLDAN